MTFGVMMSLWNKISKRQYSHIFLEFLHILFSLDLLFHFRIFKNSKEGGLRPPSISPCGAGVLAPDCRGPSAPSSQSLRNSYKVGHYCVYPVTICKRLVVLSLQVMMSKKPHLIRSLSNKDIFLDILLEIKSVSQ